MTALVDKLQAMGTVFDLVGEVDYVDAVAKATMAYEASGYKDSEATRDCEREIDLACTHTASLLGQAKAASTLLDVVSPYWRDLIMLWPHKRGRLHDLWDPVFAVLARTFSVTTASSEFVAVQDGPAAPEFVQALHYLSTKEPALRLMFIEADDADTVYVGTVANEAALDAMLKPYPNANWRGHEVLSEDGEFVVTEFRVYKIGAHRVFRTHGYVCSCDKGAIEVLKSGTMLPHVAATKTASLLRMTFSLQAMTDPHFRDFLRELGGSPMSKVSWDVPVHEHCDIENTLRRVENAFAYPVQIYQVIDTIEQNIYAHTRPESQVVRILSGKRSRTVTGTVAAATTYDIAEYVSKFAAETEGVQFHALEHVLGACAIAAHYVVTRKNELHTGSIPEMFCARTESDPVRVQMVVGGRYPVLVTEDAVCDN